MKNTRHDVRSVSGLSLLAAGGLFLAAGAPSAQAALTLTAAGIADGFGLTTFVTGIPNNGPVGPLGIATNAQGQVVVQVYGLTNYVFNDVDNQTFSQALSAASPAISPGSYGMAITNAGGVLYAGNNDTGQVIKLNNDGSLNSAIVTTPGGTVAGHGIATNPVNGDVITSSSNGLWDVNPTTGAARQIVNTGGSVDGVSVSTNGTVVYGAVNGGVTGWNIATGAVVYTSPNIGSPDGTGVISGNNPFAGDVVANANDGTLWLLDPTGLLPDGNAFEEIANGGSRGDYVGIDGNNGSLLLSQTNSIARLTCGANCAFGSPTPTPEPASLTLLGFGALALRALRRRAGLAR